MSLHGLLIHLDENVKPGRVLVAPLAIGTNWYALSYVHPFVTVSGHLLGTICFQPFQGRIVDTRHVPPTVAHKWIRGNSAVVSPCLLG
jgi:hypothetical protein